jgi:uncharacterized protein YndB with AHSA1/START domain/quinol monooxygenase YgiN
VNASTIAVRRTIVVDAPQEKCFETFVNMTSWWPLATHTIGEAPARASIVQTRAGGRWYDVSKNGDENEIGKVLAYEPPDRILLSWEISCAWKHDESVASEVEVRFVPESPTRTRIELEHRNLEVYGADAETARNTYESDGAWTYVLAQFANALRSPGAFAATALHYYVDEHRAAFESFCRRVMEHAAGTPGLVRFELLHDADGKRLVGSSLWESRASFEAALPVITALAPERKPEWSARPDEVFVSDVLERGGGT